MHSNVSIASCILILFVTRTACTASASGTGLSGQDTAGLPWVNVWQSATDPGVAVYRIPAVVVTAAGTLVAFAEARSSMDDCAYKWLVARRSTDAGRTWGPNIAVAGKGATGNATGNPQVLFDSISGRVVVTYAVAPVGSCNPSRSTFVVHDNGTDGAVWSTPEPFLTGNWPGLLPGPGNGVVTSALSPVPGRLVFIGHWGAYVDDVAFWSDDGGTTFVTSAQALPIMDEPAIVELWNGTLMANMRNNHANACNCRAISFSHDAGATWSAITFDPVLIEPVCEASLVNIANVLYFSNPASTTARANITIRRTALNSTAWLPQTVLVASGPQFGGYTVLLPGTLPQLEIGSADGAPSSGILYERTDPTLPPAQQSTIAFSVFTLEF